MSITKIGIISDTHGLLRPAVLDILKTCDCILHAGDVTRPELLDQLRPLASIYVVRGNNDRSWQHPLSKTLSFTIAGVNFYMVHDKRDAHWNLGDTQVVIYGHSHIYSEEIKDNRLWLNPGSCGYSRFGREVTMAVMKIENGQYEIEKIILPDV